MIDLRLGDCLDVLKTLEPGSVDACVTDPPGGLKFMGADWDSDRGGRLRWVEWLSARLSAARTVSKPGAYLLCWALPRTSHWTGLAIEDAGWVVRDRISHLFGQGFPKSKACLKPACEDWWLAWNPAKRVTELQIDRCRIGAESIRSGGQIPGKASFGCDVRDASGSHKWNGGGRSEHSGRWPANVTHDGSPEVMEAFGAFGEKSSHGGGVINRNVGGFARVLEGRSDCPPVIPPGLKHQDSGSAARFFKECKPDDLDSIFCHAKAIIEAWTQNDAKNAEGSSFPPNRSADSVLDHAVCVASNGAIRLTRNSPELSTGATPSELRRLCESVTAAILSSGSGLLPERPPGRLIPNGSRASVAGTSGPTGTMTITVSHWKSDGSADAATFACTPPNSDHGVKDFDGPRFIYCAKASRRDRNEGLEGMGDRGTSHSAYHQTINSVRRCQDCQRTHPMTHKGSCLRCDSARVEVGPAAMDGSGRDACSTKVNAHPTVKPTNLMRWLCRLITPPGGLILDPFMGSGSTGKAAVMEGFGFVGVEQDAEYLRIAERRIAEAQAATPLLEACP